MATYCPKCGSSRLRRGYSQTPLYLRAVGINQFLCDGCNLLFRAFGLPPERSRGQVKPAVRGNRTDVAAEKHEVALSSSGNQRHMLDLKPKGSSRVQGGIEVPAPGQSQLSPAPEEVPLSGSVSQPEGSTSKHRRITPLLLLSFSFYYFKLVLKVLLRLHQTTHPLGIGYRWRNWRHWQKSKGRQRH